MRRSLYDSLIEDILGFSEVVACVSIQILSQAGNLCTFRERYFSREEGDKCVTNNAEEEAHARSRGRCEIIARFARRKVAPFLPHILSPCVSQGTTSPLERHTREANLVRRRRRARRRSGDDASRVFIPYRLVSLTFFVSPSFLLLGRSLDRMFHSRES